MKKIMKNFLFLTFVVFVSCINDENNQQTQFSLFNKTYNKTYNNQDEIKRYNLYKKNYEIFGTVNDLSDIDEGEEDLEELNNKKAELPKSFNYSGYLGTPKNQGSSCGFCFAFSLISQIEALYSIKFGKTYRFSEQELLDCTELYCNGTSYEKLANIINNRGYLAFQNEYSAYDGIKTPSRCQKIKNIIDKYSKTKRLKLKLEKYPIFENKPFPSVHCLKSVLIEYGPLGTGIHHSLLDGYKNGIIRKNTTLCETQKPDHAVTIVGYGYEKDTKKTYWIVRNSYGTDFGEKGYFRVEAGSNICNIEKDITYLNLTWDSWCSEGCDSCRYDSMIESPVCGNCIDGYGFNSENSRCYKCSKGCKSCSYPLTCEECKEGFFKLNNMCTQCIKNCKKCNGLYSDNCQEWYFGSMEDVDTFIDDQITECFCGGRYLVNIISLILLSLLI